MQVTNLLFKRQRLVSGLALCGLISLQLAHSAMATEVLIVTDSRHAVAPVSGARMIELDLPARIDSELSANLPADPDRATAIVQQRFRDGGLVLQRRIQTAYQDNTDARALGVAKVPAVIVDRQFVVYGEPNVERALARIEAHRKAAR